MILPVIFITKSKLYKPRVYKRQFTVAQDALTELLLAILFHFWFVITCLLFFYLSRICFNLCIINVFYLQEDDLKWVEENIPSSAADA